MTALERLRAELSKWPTAWRANVQHDEDLEENAWCGSWSGDANDGEDVEFGPDDDCSVQLGDFVAGIVNAAPALLDLAEAVQRWRDAKRETQSATTDDYMIAADDECAGDNHAEACPVEVARITMLEALEKLEAP